MIEASGKVPAEAVQAAVAESKSRFVINKKSLVALADAGVSESVIDLMIGTRLSAALRRRTPRRRWRQRSARRHLGRRRLLRSVPVAQHVLGGMYADCYGYNAWGYRSYYYSMCGPYSPYATYGYYGYGGYGGYYPYYPGGGWVVVDPTPPGTAVPAVEGRVVNGRGYTQVRPRDAEPAPVRTSNNGNGSRPATRAAARAACRRRAIRAGRPAGRRAAAARSGGDSGARMAVPRPPGGGL